MPGSRDIKEDASRIYDVHEHIKSKSHTCKVETRQKERKTSDVRAPTAAAGIISPSAIKQRAHRQKRSLPESPTKLAQVIKHVVDNATQRKNICLRTVGLTNRNSPVRAKRALATISSANSRQGTWTTSAT